MKSYGSLLRNYIKQGGYSNYGIAKKAEINRTTLQKVLAGERIPSTEFMNRLLGCLKLTSEEKEELLNRIELSRSGKNVYQSRFVIRKMLQSISEIVEAQRAFGMPLPPVVPVDSCLTFSRNQLFHGTLAVERLLNYLIQEECLNTSPLLQVNVPGDNELLNRVFMHTLQYCADYLRLKVTHLTAFIKSTSHQSAAYTNVDILSNLLPFIFLSGFKYDIFYYYASHYPDDDMRMAFPYYIIFSHTVVLLSADCTTALPCQDSVMVCHFNNLFDAALVGTVPLMAYCSDTEQLLPHLIQIDESDLPVYSLEYQPCFSAYLTEEIVGQCFRTEIPDHKNRILMLMRRVRQLSGLQNRICVFNKIGLAEFVKTGYLSEFPKEYMVPMSSENRRCLLEKLYQEIATDTQKHRMVNPLMFPLPDYLTCLLHQDKGLDFNRYALGGQNFNYIYITEQTLLDTFLDFFQYLLKTPFVCSKEDTLLFIRECVDSLESQEDWL